MNKEFTNLFCVQTKFNLMHSIMIIHILKYLGELFNPNQQLSPSNKAAKTQSIYPEYNKSLA